MNERELDLLRRIGASLRKTGQYPKLADEIDKAITAGTGQISAVVSWKDALTAHREAYGVGTSHAECLALIETHADDVRAAMVTAGRAALKQAMVRRRPPRLPPG